MKFLMVVIQWVCRVLIWLLLQRWVKVPLQLLDRTCRSKPVDVDTITPSFTSQPIDTPQKKHATPVTSPPGTSTDKRRTARHNADITSETRVKGDANVRTTIVTSPKTYQRKMLVRSHITLDMSSVLVTTVGDSFPAIIILLTLRSLVRVFLVTIRLFMFRRWGTRPLRFLFRRFYTR